jgi:hypothetical protein
MASTHLVFTDTVDGRRLALLKSNVALVELDGITIVEDTTKTLVPTNAKETFDELFKQLGETNGV